MAKLPPKSLRFLSDYCVLNGRKIGVIDSLGNIVVPVIYDIIDWDTKINSFDTFEVRRDFRRGNFVVGKGETNMSPFRITSDGVTDTSGRMLIPLKNRAVISFGNYLTTSGYSPEKEIWDRSGKLVKTYPYFYANQIANNLLELTNFPVNTTVKSPCLILDTTLNVVGSHQYISLTSWHTFNTYRTASNQIGFLDKSGRTLLPELYDGIGSQWYPDSRTTLLAVSRNNKYGFVHIQNNFKLVIPIKFDSYKQSRSESAIFVKLHEKWGIIDKNGANLTPFKYHTIEKFSNGYATANDSNFHYLLNLSGREIIRDTLEVDNNRNPDGIFTTGNAKYISLYDSTGQLLYHGKKSEIKRGATPFLHTILINGNWHLVTFPSGQVSQIGFDSVRCLGPDFSLVQKGNQWMFVRANGTEPVLGPQEKKQLPQTINPAHFEKTGLLSEENGWLRIQQNGKWGWIDPVTGKIVIPCMYDAATPFKNGRARVIQQPYPQEFTINTKGEFLISAGGDFPTQY